MADTTEDRISWHPAFLPALQLTFEDYFDVLDFEAEHPLTREPLRIDGLVIKKKPEVVIDNPIARIFRQYNILEYKSPAGKLTVKDFDKLLLYGLGYEVVDKKDLADISISLVVSKAPDTLIKYIQDIWGYEITERERGIYEITGSPFAGQLIYTKELSEADNPFLLDLDDELDTRKLTEVLKLGDKPHRMDISAYVDAIVRANEVRLKELIMINSPALERIIEESGLAARWEKRAEERGEKRGEARGEKRGEARGEKRGEARGEKRGEARAKERERREIAQKLIRKGWAKEEVAETTQLDLAAVESLYQELGAHV